MPLIAQGSSQLVRGNLSGYGDPCLLLFANSNLTVPGEQLLSEMQPASSQVCRSTASISFHFQSICGCQKLAPYLTGKGMLGILLFISLYINDDFKALIEVPFPPRPKAPWQPV